MHTRDASDVQLKQLRGYVDLEDATSRQMSEMKLFSNHRSFSTLSVLLVHQFHREDLQFVNQNNVQGDYYIDSHRFTFVKSSKTARRNEEGREYRF